MFQLNNLNNKWGTKYPINIVDAKFEQVPIRAFGSFSFKVENPIKFMKEVTSTNKEYTSDMIKDQLISFIIEEFPGVAQREEVSVIQLSQSLSKISNEILNEVNDNFSELGLVMTALTIENINLPDEIQDMLNTRTSINILGGMDNYSKLRTLDVMEKSVENEGLNGMSHAGIGLGLGFNMMNQFTQGLNSNQPVNNQTFNSQPLNNSNVIKQEFNNDNNSNQVLVNLCPNCNTTNNISSNFCHNCGFKFLKKSSVCECGQEIIENSKFCSNCGKKH